MKKIAILLVSILCVSLANASKLSEFLRKSEERDRVRVETTMRQDMNFADFSFRLNRNFRDDRSGENCRDYEFRSKSNPYKHGYYTICER